MTNNSHPDIKEEWFKLSRWSNNRKGFLRYCHSQRSLVCGGTRKPPTAGKRDWQGKSNHSTPPKKERCNPNSGGPQWESHQVTEAESRIGDWVRRTERAYGCRKVGSEQPAVQCAELSGLSITGLHPTWPHSSLQGRRIMNCHNTKTFPAKCIGLTNLVSLNDFLSLSHLKVGFGQERQDFYKL